MHTARVVVTALLATMAIKASAQTIDGPDTIEAYRLVRLSLVGKFDTAIWFIEPDTADYLSLDDSAVFTGPPGVYRVNVVTVRQEGGKIILGHARKIVKIEGSQVNPPNPPAPQPGPAGKKQVMFLLQSDTLDNLTSDQRRLLASLVVRQRVSGQGHAFLGCFDVDSVRNHREYGAWVQAAERVGLPAMLVAPLQGGQITVYRLPGNETEMFNILNR